MKHEFSRHLILLIVISMICIVTLPIASAADTRDSSLRVSHSTPEQVEMINKLWGSDITIGEYMEKVHPEHLVDVSAEEKKNLYQRKMTWPDGKKDRMTELSRLTSLTVFGYITKVSSTRIDYRGKSELSSGVAGYIYVEAFLVNAADSNVDSTAASSRGANSVETVTKMYFSPANGNYHVHTSGYTITPDLSGSGHSGSVTIP